jgi:hypothetical protein
MDAASLREKAGMKDRAIRFPALSITPIPVYWIENIRLSSLLARK